MPDRENVIKAIEYLNWYFTQDDGAADKNAVKAWKVVLKEQEPVEPYWSLNTIGEKDVQCGSCIAWLYDNSWSYCPWCGKKVKRDD